ncbi:unnamed protein product [Phytomonas sp. EM1]|nr:unnamed protein product [Phytomonas sp. EM1]|eukprot:CCW65328.1 unnamed protein product [Phytomonas sp. isolate EM1]
MDSDELLATQLSGEKQVRTIANEKFSEFRQIEPTEDSEGIQIITECVPITTDLDDDKGGRSKIGVLGKLLSSRSISEVDLKEVCSDMVMQERIIATLQKDNEILRNKSKDLSLKNIELSNHIANLEAKHSLLASSVESEAQLNKKRVEDIQKLTTTISELKRKCEEAEKSKTEMWARLDSIKPGKVEDKCTFTEASITCETSVTGGEILHDNDSKHVSWTKESTDNKEIGLSDLRKVKKKISKSKDTQANINNLESLSKNRQTTHITNTNHGSKRLEENRLIKMKDSRIRQLEDALVEKERYMASALQRLKDESDKLSSQYKEKIHRLELQLKDKENSEGVRANIIQNTPNIDRETVLLKERLLKCEKLLTDNYRFIDLLNKQWERCVEDMKKSHSEQLQLIHKNHDDELTRLQNSHQLELGRISKMKYINEDIKFMNRKLIKMASNEKSENFLLAFLDRLSYLEKRCKQREEDVAFEIAESKRVAEVERRLLAERMSLIIEQKNQQIKHFQIELDELLAHIRSLSDPGNLFSARIYY